MPVVTSFVARSVQLPGIGAPAAFVFLASGPISGPVVLAASLRLRVRALDGPLQQEIRRDQTDGAGTAHPGEFAIQQRRGGSESRQVTFGIRPIPYRLIAVEHLWDVEVAANILNHYIRAVSPVADGGHAVGQGHAFQSGTECALDNGHAGQSRGIEALAR